MDGARTIVWEEWKTYIYMWIVDCAMVWAACEDWKRLGDCILRCDVIWGLSKVRWRGRLLVRLLIVLSCI